jgi:hypothetical protein
MLEHYPATYAVCSRIVPEVKSTYLQNVEEVSKFVILRLVASGLSPTRSDDT